MNETRRSRMSLTALAENFFGGLRHDFVNKLLDELRDFFFCELIDFAMVFFIVDLKRLVRYDLLGSPRL